MTDQQSPWRSVATDPPSESAIVLASTERGSVQVMWITPGGGWQAIHPAEAPPFTRRKARDGAPDPPVHWMPIPQAPWNPGDSTLTRDDFNLPMQAGQ
jgi:hypothetical protein